MQPRVELEQCAEVEPLPVVDIRPVQGKHSGIAHVQPRTTQHPKLEGKVKNEDLLQPGDQPETAMTRIRTHPGHTLRAELAERGISANQLALAIRVPANRITAILRSDRAITAETAVRLGRHLGTGAQFWMNLQSQFDISVVEATQGEVIERELAGGSSP